jgi:hypothetical protein
MPSRPSAVPADRSWRQGAQRASPDRGDFAVHRLTLDPPGLACSLRYVGVRLADRAPVDGPPSSTHDEQNCGRRTIGPALRAGRIRAHSRKPTCGSAGSMTPSRSAVRPGRLRGRPTVPRPRGTPGGRGRGDGGSGGHRGRFLGAGDGEGFAAERQSRPGVLLRLVPIVRRVESVGDPAEVIASVGARGAEARVAAQRCVDPVCLDQPPTWMAGRRRGSSSTSRSTSRVTGAVSPLPKSR